MDTHEILSRIRSREDVSHIAHQFAGFIVGRLDEYRTSLPRTDTKALTLGLLDSLQGMMKLALGSKPEFRQLDQYTRGARGVQWFLFAGAGAISEHIEKATDQQLIDAAHFLRTMAEALEQVAAPPTLIALKGGASDEAKTETI